ncbi:MAG: DUF3106 domain-containing protein [Betaproteobacteria bacterium]|nr:DUF3106 domain-containing protein [Betaproteobacteria bacterium]NBX88698.1 DUF3106 domain-containing protein [Betaproteobacteria bacterium]
MSSLRTSFQWAQPVKSAVYAGALCLLAAGLGVATPTSTWAQNAAPTSSPAYPGQSNLPKKPTASVAPASSGAAWGALTPIEKNALAPLAPHWAQLSSLQKSKWLAISKNFDKLSVTEQATLHHRMTDWVALSPQQRALARLNFNETKNLGADEKKTQWEAYQALSAEEKRKLASQQSRPLQGAAPATKAPPDKLMRLPGKGPAPPDANNPNAGPVLDPKTLLPTPAVASEGA